jgi:hypothetical protein
MNGLSHPWLMRESQRRVEEAACSPDVRQQLVAKRVLTDPSMQRIWEREHSRYMRGVADEWRRPRQLVALRSVAFGLIHRKALFEYLRDDAVRGEKRRRIVALFHGSLTYTEAVVAEHHRFLRSALSHLCAEHIGSAVVGDPAFDEPLRAYEGVYLQYLRRFCETHAWPWGSDDPQPAVLQYLKLRLTEQRQAILALGDRPPPRSRPFAVVALGETARPEPPA